MSKYDQWLQSPYQAYYEQQERIEAELDEATEFEAAEIKRQWREKGEAYVATEIEQCLTPDLAGKMGVAYLQHRHDPQALGMAIRNLLDVAIYDYARGIAETKVR